MATNFASDYSKGLMVSTLHRRTNMGTIVYSILLFALLFHVDEVLGQATSGTPFATSQAGSFATPLTSNLIDNGALAEWMDGTERPLANPALLRQFIWTRTTQSAGGQFEFGSSNQPGPRHLRIGFTAPVAFESILVRGGGGVSVLRPGSPYPGNLIDETQWITAKRVVNGQPSNAEVDKGSYALWILPSGTRTRALRFTHISSLTDSNYSGVLGGIYLLADRFANLAPQAKVAVSANFSNARLLVDEQDNNWLAWDNGPEFRHPVSPSSPEWIILSWSQPVSIRGLATLWAGFNAASVQVLFGPEDLVPTTAPESAWRSVGADYNLRSQYPRALGVDWMDFGKTVVTRAIRVRLTQVTDESHHSHLIGKTKNGTRVWLGELMALAPMGAGELQPLAASARVSDAPHAPIPVQFSIASPGYVTLAIDDAKGDRIRNLVSDTWFEAGKNTVWWDGTDDLGRNPEAAQHGVYLIPTHFVAPGHYEVRGLFHKAIDLHYEFSVYSAGNPPWETADTKGGWLTNHTPPSSALFLPADKAPGGKPLMYLGSYVSEGGAGLAWVDLEGNKQGGRGWIGGAWTAAPFLARDSGPSANADIYAYVGSAWYQDVNKDQKQPSIVIRLTGLTSHGDKAIPGYSFNPGDRLVSDITKRPNSTDQMGGLTIYNGLIAVSLSLQDQILFIEAASGRLLGKIASNKPTGLVFDAQGRLLVLAGKQLLRYKISQDPADFQSGRLPAPQTLVGEGLEDPAGITTDSSGNIYISDRGKSSQVKIFSQSGAFLRSIGHAGLPQAGPYDALHMNNPRGMAIDSDNHLWVAEEDFQPKRVSLWTLDGKFVRAFYGPSEYGGGGTLDPQDKTKFYYHGMEFKLDWVSGRDSIASVLYRPEKDALLLPRFGEPGTVLYRNGHRYFTNCYMNYPTNGVSIGMLFLDRSGIIRPVAALGKASDWDVFKGPEFKALLPAGSDLSSRAAQDAVLFSWSDQNGDGKIDPEEVTFVKSTTGAITVMPDLSMIDALVNGQVIQYVPGKFSSEGTPAYDLKKGQVIGDGAQIPSSDGGGQVLYSPQATVMTTAPLPFSRDGVGGIDSSNHRWSYPSLWPGLHPAHSAPIPDHPGELVGTTRLLGGFINPPGTDTGPLWGINGNFGNMYLFTADGFFVTQLFQDVRVGKPWSMPTAKRDMLLNDISLHDENFFPSLTQTNDGQVYVVDGGRTSVVRVDGLASLRRILPTALEVTTDQIQKAQGYLRQNEVLRQDIAGQKVLNVGIRSGAAPALAGLIDILSGAEWATVDRRITQVGWNGQPDLVEAALTVAGGRLFAAFRSSDPKLLLNSAAVQNAPFKTGGALDLMIGGDPGADPGRSHPAAGDIRLLVYLASGKPQAMLYRAAVPGTATPVPFSSPARTVTFDQVADVTDQLQFLAQGGNYMFSIPVAMLGLKPVPGETIKADIGVLRGNGVQTLQRVYWSNKATGITADVPSEAELTPNLWGEWIFKAQP